MTPETEKFFEYMAKAEIGISLMLDMGDGTCIMVKRLMFHYTLIQCEIGDVHSYFDRWCYATKELAEEQATKWFMSDPRPKEPEGWHRHPNTGRRRTDGDPATEYIAW